MAERSAIEWTDATWNPVTGCTKVSPGCAHCYAETFAERWRGTPGHHFEQGFDLRLFPERLAVPLRWRRPRRVFVNSMSDLFHEGIPFEYIAAVFGVMGAADQHTFQVLTKRPERMLEFFAWYHQQCRDHELVADEMPWLGIYRARDHDVAGLEMADAVGYDWPLRNVWLGVSIENRRYVDRADLLRQTPAAVRFISAEPLIGPLIPDRFSHVFGMTWQDRYAGPGLDLTGIDWLIAGGESGPRHRRVDEAWVRSLRGACSASGTAFFLKQWGGARPGGEALLDGVAHRAFPKAATA